VCLLPACLLARAPLHAENSTSPPSAPTSPPPPSSSPVGPPGSASLGPPPLHSPTLSHEFVIREPPSSLSPGPLVEPRWEVLDNQPGSLPVLARPQGSASLGQPPLHSPTLSHEIVTREPPSSLSSRPAVEDPTWGSSPLLPPGAPSGSASMGQPPLHSSRLDESPPPGLALMVDHSGLNGAPPTWASLAHPHRAKMVRNRLSRTWGSSPCHRVLEGLRAGRGLPPLRQRRSKRKRETLADSSQSTPSSEIRRSRVSQAVQEWLRFQVHSQPVSKSKIYTKWGLSQGSFNRSLDDAVASGAVDAIMREEQRALAARASSEGGNQAKKDTGQEEEGGTRGPALQGHWRHQGAVQEGPRLRFFPRQACRWFSGHRTHGRLLWRS